MSNCWPTSVSRVFFSVGFCFLFWKTFVSEWLAISPSQVFKFFYWCLVLVIFWLFLIIVQFLVTFWNWKNLCERVLGNLSISSPLSSCVSLTLALLLWCSKTCNSMSAYKKKTNFIPASANIGEALAQNSAKPETNLCKCAN